MLSEVVVAFETNANVFLYIFSPISLPNKVVQCVGIS